MLRIGEFSRYSHISVRMLRPVSDEREQAMDQVQVRYEVHLNLAGEEGLRDMTDAGRLYVGLDYDLSISP